MHLLTAKDLFYNTTYTGTYRYSTPKQKAAPRPLFKRMVKGFLDRIALSATREQRDSR